MTARSGGDPEPRDDDEGAALAWRALLGPSVDQQAEIEVLHDIGRRLAAADPLHTVLVRLVQLLAALVRSDSCFIYLLEGDALVLRASKTPHDDVVGQLRLKIGQGITGWVAEHREPVAVESRAFEDPRFQSFNELPEDRYEAFLSVPVLSRGKVVGVINLQHRRPHRHSTREVQLVATVGFLVGAELERARLEEANAELADALETRKIVERAKGILQRTLGLSEAIVLAEDLRRAQETPPRTP
jgi:uroporphyrinogen-III synthase